MFQEIVLQFDNPVAALQVAQTLDQQYNNDQLTGLGLLVRRGNKNCYPSFVLVTFEDYPAGFAEVRQRYAAQVSGETIDGMFVAYRQDPHGWLYVIPSATPPLLQSTAAALPTHADYPYWVQGN